MTSYSSENEAESLRDGDIHLAQISDLSISLTFHLTIGVA